MIVTGRVKADDGTWDLKLSYHSSDRVNESFKDFVYPAFAKSSETTYTLIKMTTIRGQ